MSATVNNQAARASLSIERVLRSETLPTLPAVAMQLLQKTSDPDVTISDIAELIQSDPGLAGKVLKTVNSSFYGLPRPCPSIDRAIAMLGLRAVKSLVLGFSMLNLTNDLGEALDLNDFWHHAVYCSAGAREIAKLMGVAEPDEVFAAALFQDMGVLALLSVEAHAYGPVFIEAGGSHAKLRELEQGRFNIDHADLGSMLAERWRMPEEMVQSIRFHHNPGGATAHQQIVKAVAMGQRAAAAIRSASGDGQVDQFVAQAQEALGLAEDQVAPLLEDIRNTAREIARVLDQSLGEVPSVDEIMSRAGQILVEHQMAAERESVQAQQRVFEAEKAATTDALTQIGNRKLFDERVERDVAEAYKAGTPVATLFSDADKFKSVNDTYGHHVGDAVLIELARRLSETLGDRGLVCRYGGEEFAFVLPGMNLQQAIMVGEELRRCIADSMFDLSKVEDSPTELPRTVSVGVAAWEAGDEKVPALELVQRADKAVYLAKESGRNNVKAWGMDLGRRAADQPPAPKAESDRKVSVLVIEDDALASRLMQVMLERTHGTEVTMAVDGREAVEHLRVSSAPGKSLPDLIICDLNIPGFNGLQILRALKTNPRYSHIPIYIVSATEDQALRQSCHDSGAAGVYNKREISVDMKAWCEGLVRSFAQAA